LNSRDEASFCTTLVGARCSALWQLEFRLGGTLRSPCTALFLQRSNERWLRFFFDGGEFFWRPVAEPEPDFNDGTFSYRKTPVPDADCMIGALVEAVEFAPLQPAALRELNISFSTGASLRLLFKGGESQLSVLRPAPQA